MALTSGNFSKANADAMSAAYAKKFGAAPDVLHTQTGDGADLVPL